MGISTEPFYIYRDADYSKNHFTPSGYMGDCGDIRMVEAWKENPHSGGSCIKVEYSAKGKGPSKIDYPPPAKWAGVYWQYPPNNWGTDSGKKDKGIDLSGYKRTVFWARSEKPCQIEFKVGGIAEIYGDSLRFPRSVTASLDQTWREFTIDLSDADLKHIVGGFAWVTNWDTNPDGATFYLDDIRFEKGNH